MLQLFDRSILFLICLYLFHSEMSYPWLIVSAALAFSVSCFLYYFENQYIRLGLFLFYGLFSCFSSFGILFLPLLIQDYFETFNRMWQILYTLILDIHPYIHLQTDSIFPLTLLCGVSYLMYYKTNKIMVLKQQLISQRDNSVELQLALSQKNKNLIEMQNTKIHLATLQERNRIAREIHDNVGHLLTRSILQIGAIEAILKEDHLKKPVTEVKQTLNLAMTNIRSSVHDLHDESIDLNASIKEAVSCLSDYKLSLDLDVTSLVSRDLKYCFIAVVKEAATNILKHSNATQVTILIREHPAFYQLVIEDNGTNISTVHTSGIGLTNMEDRVHSLNGTLRIQSENGFHIFITIPKQ